MRYILLYIILVFMLKSDLNIFNFLNLNWTPSIFLKTSFDKLHPGDILVKKKELKYLEWFGHCGVITKEKNVAEIISPFSALKYSKIDLWAYENRSVIVLRLNNKTNSDFYHSLSVNIDENIGKKYGFVPKNSNSKFYCSQFIWYIFNKTKYSYNLDSDNGLTVWPYDFLFSNQVSVVNLK